QKPETLRAEFLPRGGGPCSVSLTVSPICWDAEGRVAGLSIAAEDLDCLRERKSAAQRLVHAFEHSPVAIAIVGEESRAHELVNPAYARLHGYGVEELCGRPLRDLISQDLPEPDAGRRAFETVRIRKDGVHFPVLVDKTPVAGEDGRVAYRIVTVSDLSRTKELEAGVRERDRHQVVAEASRLFGESRFDLEELLDKLCEATVGSVADGAYVQRLSEDGSRIESMAARH